MASQDPWTGARVGDMNDAPAGGLFLAEMVQELGKWTAPGFGSADARDSALAAWVADGNTADDGMTCYVAGIGRMLFRSGHWVPLTLQVYSSLALRDAAFPSPIKGDACICLGTHMVHDGLKWRFTLSGKASGNCDSNGFFSFPHGGGQAPTGWVITPSYQATDALSLVISILNSNNAGDPTFLGCRAVRTDSHTYLGINPINVNWTAQF